MRRSKPEFWAAVAPDELLVCSRAMFLSPTGACLTLCAVFEKYLQSAWCAAAHLPVGKGGALQEEIGEDHAGGDGVDAHRARAAWRGQLAWRGRLGGGTPNGQRLPQLCRQAAHELPDACNKSTQRSYSEPNTQIP